MRVTKRKPDPTQPAAWVWKSGAFRRCLTLCKTEASAEKFIAREFAGIYTAAWIHGREGLSYLDNTSKPKIINQKRAHAAEEFCRAFRKVATMRVADATPEDWSRVMDYLQRWMRLAGKSRYADPKGWPAEKQGTGK